MVSTLTYGQIDDMVQELNQKYIKYIQTANRPFPHPDDHILQMPQVSYTMEDIYSIIQFDDNKAENDDPAKDEVFLEDLPALITPPTLPIDLQQFITTYETYWGENQWHKYQPAFTPDYFNYNEQTGEHNLYLQTTFKEQPTTPLSEYEQHEQQPLAYYNPATYSAVTHQRYAESESDEDNTPIPHPPTPYPAYKMDDALLWNDQFIPTYYYLNENGDLIEEPLFIDNYFIRDDVIDDDLIAEYPDSI